MSLLRKGILVRRGGKKPVPVLIDSYDIAVDSEGFLTTKHPSNISALSSLGQTFKPTLTRRLTSVKFKLRKSTGDLTGTLKAYLYAHSGTFGSGGIPIGEALAESIALDMSTLTTTITLHEFTFDDTYILKAGTPYCILLYSLDGNMTVSVYPKISRRNIGAHEGEGVFYRYSAWSTYSTIDHIFYVYGV